MENKRGWTLSKTLHGAIVRTAAGLFRRDDSVQTKYSTMKVKATDYEMNETVYCRKSETNIALNHSQHSLKT